jgi:hypothetical protein
MRPRRSFVAKPPATSDAVDRVADAPEKGAWPTSDEAPRADKLDAAEELDDLPVLTDVVAFDDAIDGADRRQERIDETQVALLAAQIAHSIGEQLARDLPGLIETALASAGEQLSRGIGATMETALQDFIAHRRQLALPLDEPRDGDV